ncbi:MAG: enoyl-acyl carrier protein reductase FabMG [Massilia sp.]
MTELTSLRHIPQANVFRKGDVFVLFGELFGRGYVNGLIDEARAAGMTIVGITVGRRDEGGALRALTAEEHAEAEEKLGGRIINVPLMAGFDMDAPEGEQNPTEMLAGVTLKGWQEDKLDWAKIERCREAGVRRFTEAARTVMGEIDKLVPQGANVFFAHTMAGGIPKIKAFLAIANRIYKGRGERFMSSRALLDSDLGKLILMNFDEVTANTLKYLIDASAPIRERVAKAGGEVRYTAYGYHGTEILIGGEYVWQTYTNYTQGYAKMRLESIAQAAWSQGIAATVFNCPEIRTNSSDIFVGVELSLFPLLAALKKEGGAAWADEQWNICQQLLGDGVSLQSLLDTIERYNQDATSAKFRNFEAWPMDNTPELADVMIGTSEQITALHKDRKALITDHLSALVLEGAGPLMFHGASEKIAPVLWLNHDIIAKQLNELHR